MNLAVVEPFFGGAHKSWIQSLQSNLDFQFHLFTLPARHWKWRMEAAAISLAKKVNQSNEKFDCFLVSDMLNLSLFKSLLSVENQKVKTILYFHENQLAYPWSSADEDIVLKRDRHYQFINYTAALVADLVLFNSNYNKDSFLNALPKFLKAFPDHQNLDTIELIKNKSEILPLAFDLNDFKKERADKNNLPILLWNHRWEYDKNPALFFKTLFKLKTEAFKFQLIVLGEKTNTYPKIFEEAKVKLADEIIHFGYVNSKEEYVALLRKADCLPVTSVQDFFGISTIEAVAAGCYPILPKRLAYPEHFESNVFYDNTQDFESKLKGFISSWKAKDLDELNRTRMQLIQEIDKYDWKNLKEKYLQYLSS